MVGAERFELSTSCTPSKRASQATLRPDRKEPSQDGGAEYRGALSALQQTFHKSISVVEHHDFLDVWHGQGLELFVLRMRQIRIARRSIAEGHYEAVRQPAGQFLRAVIGTDGEIDDAGNDLGEPLQFIDHRLDDG